jgi:hypothetical protein
MSLLGGEALAVICLNGSGEGGQQIAKRQVSHLVVLISRDPFWTAANTKEPIMASLTQTRESGFEPTLCTGLKKAFFAKKSKQRASGCGNVAWCAFDKTLEADPEACAQAFKEAAA